MHAFPRKPPRSGPRRGMEAFASRDFRRFQLARVAAVLGLRGAIGGCGLAGLLHHPSGHRPGIHRAGAVSAGISSCCLPAMWPTASIAARSFSSAMACRPSAPLALLLLARGGTAHRSIPSTWCFSSLAPRVPSQGRPIPRSFPTWFPKSTLSTRSPGAPPSSSSPTIIGPALGGILFTLPLVRFVPDTLLQGAGIVYVFTLGTLGWSLVLVGSMRTRSGRMEHRALSLKVVLAGFQ